MENSNLNTIETSAEFLLFHVTSKDEVLEEFMTSTFL